jgi:hypothetical protein
MFRLIEANAACNSLSTSMTCGHMNIVLSSTRLQSISGGKKPGQPSRSNPDPPGPMAPEDPGAQVGSPGAVLSGSPMHAPRITQSQSKPPMASPGQGLASSTSTLTAPSDRPLAPDSSHSSDVDTSGAGVPHGTTTGRG